MYALMPSRPGAARTSKIDGVADVVDLGVADLAPGPPRGRRTAIPATRAALLELVELPGRDSARPGCRPRRNSRAGCVAWTQVRACCRDPAGLGMTARCRGIRSAAVSRRSGERLLDLEAATADAAPPAVRPPLAIHRHSSGIGPAHLTGHPASRPDQSGLADPSDR